MGKVRHSDTQRLKFTLPAVVSFVVAQLIVIAVLIGPLIANSIPWNNGFRNYFANDQLSYLAIATNTSQGISPWVEPLTATGVSYYPSLWYSIIGYISGFFGINPWVMWTILGIAAACAAIGVIGGVAYRLSRRAWAPVLPAAMILTGTYSTWTNDYWYSSLNSHAVIWGPYGTLFTLNAETIGVLLVSTAVALMLLYAHRPNTFLAVTIAIMLGISANIQTYTFFTATVFSALLITAINALQGNYFRDSVYKKLLVTSAVLFVVVLIAGTFISSVVGPLPLLALLVATLIPANLPLIRAHIPKTLLLLTAFVLAAAPQIIHTVIGLLGKDTFLLYRQSSSLELGISLLSALISFIPLGALSLFAFIVARKQNNHVFMAFYIAAIIGILVMSTNDLWGFNQEPYRLWLQFTIVIAIAGSVPLAWSLAQPRTTALTIFLIFSIIAWLLSLGDFGGFYRYSAEQGVISFTDDRAQVLAEIIPQGDGLTLVSRCEDPAIFKAITGVSVADYNLGLAWPTQRDQIDQIMFGSGEVTEDQLAAAGIEYILFDSACDNEWQLTSNKKTVVSGSGYSDGILTLVRVSSQ